MTLPRGIPAQALGDLMPGVPGPAPFYRKNWDNPFKYKLNRQYGDEFEYANFAQLSSRWKMLTSGVADFRFDGGSSVQWKSSGSTDSAIYEAIPPYDFDAVLEFSRDFALLGPGWTNNWPAIGIVDVNGTGYGAGVHENGNLYHNPITTWHNPDTIGNSVASGLTLDPRHAWLCLRRTGATIQARASANGSTWTAFATADTIPGTPLYLALMRYRFSAGVAAWTTLHRLNVYAAAGYFPG